MSIATPEVDVRQTTIESIDLENLTDTDNVDGTNKDGKRHIVRPADNPHVRPVPNPTSQVVVDFARVNRIELTTLCGHKFIPSRNPEGLDTCDSCIGMAGVIRGGS